MVCFAKNPHFTQKIYIKKFSKKIYSNILIRRNLFSTLGYLIMGLVTHKVEEVPKVQSYKS
jgi:hypothetical protein